MLANYEGRSCYWKNYSEAAPGKPHRGMSKKGGGNGKDYGEEGRGKTGFGLDTSLLT